MSVEVPPEVAQVLKRWTDRGRATFAELMEDAASELQRELVQRAVLAGHSAGEVHAFADELRPLSDDECFDACTVDAAAAERLTVAQQLAAEADPLFAFTLRGGTLTPGAEEPATATMPVYRRDPMEAPEDRALAADPVRRAREQRRGFTQDSGAFQALRPTGASRASLPPVASSRSTASLPPVTSSRSTASLPPVTSSRSVASLPQVGPARAHPPSSVSMAALHPASASSMAALQPVASKLFEDLLSEATRGLGVSWSEHVVDADVTLEQALQLVANGLARGVPVPVVLGNAQGRPLRFVIALQLSTSGANRAFQLYEPIGDELVWANEKDLLARGELPFNNKALRRLVRVAAPR